MNLVDTAIFWYRRVARGQYEKGIKKWGKELTGDTPIEPFEYCMEEIADATIYLARAHMDYQRVCKQLDDLKERFELLQKDRDAWMRLVEDLDKENAALRKGKPWNHTS